MNEQQRANKRLSGKLLFATLLMFGFGFALVPLYDVMCDALGINGKTSSEAQIQPQGMVVDTSRMIHVEFMAHIKQGVDWELRPKQASMDVHPGQVIQTAYVAVNRSSERMIGQAVPSVSPGLAASHFNKIECFCFQQQGLDSQQTAELPLIFYIEPNVPASIHTLTLSYTLFDITERTSKQDVAALNMAAIAPYVKSIGGGQ
ncbi:cytochrome c oxidase assembly protein [Vibrio sp. AK197]